MTDEPIFILLAHLAEKDGVPPMNSIDGCWERTVPGIDGGEWWFAINGHRELIRCSKGAEVPPFNCYLEWNGWPAGVFSPFDGVMAAGNLANESSFIAALEKELRA